MRVSLLATIPVLGAAACAPLAWTTSGSAELKQPIAPACVSSVLRDSRDVDSAVVAAAYPPDFGASPLEFVVGAAPPEPWFAEVRFTKASGTGSLQQAETRNQVRVTAVWRWYAHPVPRDSVRALEIWLQGLVATISTECGGPPPIDTLQFLHSWESPS